MRRGRPAKVTAHALRRILELRKQDLNCKVIGIRMGIHEYTVQKYLSDCTYECEPVGAKDQFHRIPLMVWIEVKGTKGVQSPEQKAFEKEVKKSHMKYILARPLEDVTAVLA
jgi:hypothetical protein